MAAYDHERWALEVPDTTVLAPVDYVEAAWSTLTAEERGTLAREALEAVNVLVPPNGPPDVSPEGGV